MKLFGKIFGKKKTEPQEKPEPEEVKEESKQVSSNVCVACGEPGADKKFAGQWWHKKCLRKARKMAKSMI